MTEPNPPTPSPTPGSATRLNACTIVGITFLGMGVAIRLGATWLATDAVYDERRYTVSRHFDADKYQLCVECGLAIILMGILLLLLCVHHWLRRESVDVRR